MFDQGRFDEDFARAVANCSELTRDEARHFIERGFVRVRCAFPVSIAQTVREHAWAELEADHAIRRDDPRSWDRPLMRQGRGAMHGYIRTRPTRTRFNLRQEAPRAFATQADAIGGAHRLPGAGASLAWSDAAVANLGVAGHPGGVPACSRLGGWHKDGWHFRHFLNSPEQGLLTVPIYSDIAPASGGTQVATDSLAPVARLLAAHPEGLHPDSVQGAGYLIPGLIEQCGAFDELTGDVGDMVILHPFMLHRACINPSSRPRFIANAALVLAKPMCFARDEDDAYSLVELAILRALGVNRLDYRPARDMRAVLPGPVRDDAQRASERALLQEEMRSLLAAGHGTAEWGQEFGYQTNRP